MPGWKEPLQQILRGKSCLQFFELNLLGQKLWGGLRLGQDMGSQVYLRPWTAGVSLGRS